MKSSKLKNTIRNKTFSVLRKISIYRKKRVIIFLAMHNTTKIHSYIMNQQK